jgi:hypothetical protein
MSNWKNNIILHSIQWIFQPNPNINYSVISLMYACGSILYVALYSFEQWAGGVLAAQGEEGDSGSTGSSDEPSSGLLKELHSSLQGLSLVFSPFLPCLLWSLILRQRSNEKKIITASNGRDDEQKQKGE